jgi:hypothetical protein
MRKPSAPHFIALATLLAGATLGGHASAAGPNLQQRAAFVGASQAFLGYSVAVDGSTAVVGALNDNGGTGAAYVYARGVGGWSLQATLMATGGAVNDQFGYAVALSGDTAMIGAAGRANGEGAVYVFGRSGTAWQQLQELDEPGGEADDCFGCALAVSGSTALIGASGASGGLGTAFVYASGTSGWAEQAAFLGASANDFFGFSVALDATGTTAMVGAFGVSSQRGSAYVFTRAGTVWSQPQAPITPADAQANDRFGYALSIDGATALVGAYASGGPGAVYVLTRTGTTWGVQPQKLVPSDPTGGDFFGASVALSGGTAIVGASEHGGPNGPGAAYVFTSSGAGWQAAQELVAPSPGQTFGYTVAASGTTAVVGAFSANNNSGAAYVFEPAVTSPAPALGARTGALALALLLAGIGLLAVSPRRARGRA